MSSLSLIGRPKIGWKIFPWKTNLHISQKKSSSIATHIYQWQQISFKKIWRDSKALSKVFSGDWHTFNFVYRNRSLRFLLFSFLFPQRTSINIFYSFSTARKPCLEAPYKKPWRSATIILKTSFYYHIMPNKRPGRFWN